MQLRGRDTGRIWTINTRYQIHTISRIDSQATGHINAIEVSIGTGSKLSTGRHACCRVILLNGVYATCTKRNMVLHRNSTSAVILPGIHIIPGTWYLVYLYERRVFTNTSCRLSFTYLLLYVGTRSTDCLLLTLLMLQYELPTTGGWCKYYILTIIQITE